MKHAPYLPNLNLYGFEPEPGKVRRRSVSQIRCAGAGLCESAPYKLFVDPYKVLVDIYKLLVDPYKLIVDTYKLYVEPYKVFVNIYKLFVNYSIQLNT